MERHTIFQDIKIYQSEANLIYNQKTITIKMSKNDFFLYWSGVHPGPSGTS